MLGIVLPFFMFLILLSQTTSDLSDSRKAVVRIGSGSPNNMNDLTRSLLALCHPLVNNSDIGSLSWERPSVTGLDSGYLYLLMRTLSG